MKKKLYKPNYPKQYAKLSSTNLTKTCFSWMPYTQYLKNQKFKWAESFKLTYRFILYHITGQSVPDYGLRQFVAGIGHL